LAFSGDDVDFPSGGGPNAGTGAGSGSRDMRSSLPFAGLTAATELVCCRLGGEALAPELTVDAGVGGVIGGFGASAGTRSGGWWWCALGADTLRGSWLADDARKSFPLRT